MKTNLLIARWLALLALSTLNLQPSALAQGTAFIYQGQLQNNGSPASGTYNLTFSLFNTNTSGVPIAGPVTNTAVGVTNGLFTVLVDFGPGVFTGAINWLEIAVATNGVTTFTALVPRQQLTPVPYAIDAENASGLSGTLSADQLTSIGNTNGGEYNFFVGPSGNATMSGWENTANGVGALANNTSGFGNAANGYSALLFNTSGSFNTANGMGALLFNTSGSANTANGYLALLGNTNGSFNTADGISALQRNTSGSNNIALGFKAGYNITTGSSNIDIGNLGFSTDTNIIRIGSGQTQTFIAGVITGDGSGLTNVTAATAASLAIPPGMALIPAGTFTMGDNLDGLSDAIPTNVTVSAFFMDVNLVSYSQWQSVYYWAANHGYGFGHAGAGKAANHPVQTVEWYDCVKWCNARSQQAGQAPVYYTDDKFVHIYTNGETDAVYPNWMAKGYRLPTEAEWEKAARGGLSGQRFPWGNVITENLANYYGNTALSYDLGPNGYNAAFTNGMTPYTSPVGSFALNGYGLYDMAGNVFEWCWDWYDTSYGQPTTTNPTGPATGGERVLRCGDWETEAIFARCASRGYLWPDGAFSYIGFRCVRGL